MGPKYKNSNCSVAFTVDYRVRKAFEWVNSATIIRGRSQTWKLHQKPSHTLKLVEETVG